MDTTPAERRDPRAALWEALLGYGPVRPAEAAEATALIDAHAAEVRAAALTEAADRADELRQFEFVAGARKPAQVSENVGVLRVAAELRRMAAAARPDDTTTPAVGDRYDCRHGGEGVTVTRVWTLDNGHPAVDFAWHGDKPGDRGSALPLASFHRSYQPARPDDTTGA